MIEWLIPAGLFWVIAAVQFGGLLDVEGGSGFQQFLGLMATFILFLGAFALLRLALGGLGILGSVILPTAIPLLLLAWIGRLGFRLAGVKVRRARFSAGAH